MTLDVIYNIFLIFNCLFYNRKTKKISKTDVNSVGNEKLRPLSLGLLCYQIISLTHYVDPI